jgi:ABC-type transporter Mla MlaB component
MLRITVHESLEGVTLQLEGRLAVPWVHALTQCWQSTQACRHKPVVRVDLTAVTFIDAAGKACLASMHSQGATFVAGDLLTKSIVDEITRTPVPDDASSRSRR